MIATLFSPLTSQSLCNLTMIEYSNNYNNEDQIYCFFLSTLLSTLSILSTKFIFSLGVFIITICITIFYCICYHYMLSIFYNDKKAEKSGPYQEILYTADPQPNSLVAQINFRSTSRQPEQFLYHQSQIGATVS